MRENAGKMQTRITPNSDTFYAVIKGIFARDCVLTRWLSLYKKNSFSLRIYSLIVTNAQETADFVTFTEQIPK